MLGSQKETRKFLKPSKPLYSLTHAGTHARTERMHARTLSFPCVHIYYAF